MKILLLITLMTIISSCKDVYQKEDTPSSVVLNFIALTIQNNAGEDLLNPSTSGYYKHSNIKQYQITDGVKKMLSVGNKTVFSPAPNLEVKEYIMIIRNYGKKIEVSPYPVFEFFLELDSNTIDTLKVEASEFVYFDPLRKIWYNGKLVYEEGVNKLQNLIIIK